MVVKHAHGTRFSHELLAPYPPRKEVEVYRIVPHNFEITAVIAFMKLEQEINLCAQLPKIYIEIELVRVSD